MRKNMKALLVIDVQKEYMEKYDECLLSRINQKIQHSMENQELIIYTKNIKKLRSSIVTYELAENLNICSSYIICKEKASAFSNSELLNILDQNGVSEIEIIGIDGNSCVAGSATGAKKSGYKVALPCECIGVQNLERFEKTKLSLMKKGITIE